MLCPSHPKPAIVSVIFCGVLSVSVRSRDGRLTLGSFAATARGWHRHCPAIRAHTGTFGKVLRHFHKLPSSVRLIRSTR